MRKIKDHNLVERFIRIVHHVTTGVGTQRRTTKVETCGAILVSKMYTVHMSRYIDYKCGPYDTTVVFCDLKNFYCEVQLL